MNEEDRIKFVLGASKDSAALRRKVGEVLAEALVDLSNTMSGIIGAGGRIFICGNGGSAAESSHMAAEMIVRLTSLRNRQALPAMALTADTAVLTAAGNDFGFENIFARQIQGLGGTGDMLLLLSTSGDSADLLRAAEAARGRGMLIAALLGGSGGRLASIVDKKLIVPHKSVQRIQEEHIFLIHLLVELIESDLCA
jgi:D-sedoheptulose 7-phosphate isomerase